MLLVALLFGSLLAFLLSAVAGGGAGLLLLPALAFIVPAAQAPAALSIGTATSSVSRLATLRRCIRWDAVRWFAPAALPTAALGAWLLSLLEPIYIQLVLGLFLSTNLVALFSRRAIDPAPIPDQARPWTLVAVGALAGLVSGFTGAVGLLFNRFYYRLGMSKEEIVATRAANEVTLHLLKLALYAWFGLLTSQALFAGIVVAIGAVLAATATPLVLGRMPERVFRRIGLAAMVMAGVSMTTGASSQIVARNKAGVEFSVERREVEASARWQRWRYSAEVDRLEGVVIEKLVDPRTLSAPLQKRVHAVVRGGRLISLEKAVRLTGRDWEIEFERDGRVLEVNLPRQDGER